MRFFLIIFLFLISWSCSKTEEKPPVAKTGVEIVAIGSVNYGGVLLGNHKDAAIKIINHDSSSVELNLDLPKPFTIVSKSVSCSDNILGPKSECIISIRFNPDQEGAFDLELSLGSSKLPLRGVGLLDGYIVIDASRWDIGSVSAGTLRTKDITFTNLGDLTVQTPKFNLPSFLKLGFNRCGAFIAPRASCQIRFESILEVAQDYNLSIVGNSEDGGLVEFDFIAQVSPAAPSGLITFASFPNSMSSAGAEFTLVTNPIKDAFNNIVSLGTRVSVSVNNLLLLLDGTNYLTDSSGKISFRVRTRTIKGNATVSLVSGQASGFVNFPITAGSAFGTINILNSLNEIPANGQTQIVLNTQLIYDQYNNIVEDGTEVIFELTGDGQLSTGANPKRRLSYTINGIASVTVKAGITAQVASLKVFSGPIRDQLNNIVGYSANGLINLNFVPGTAEGIIPVFSSLPAIYSNTNPPSDILFLPTKSKITIGPIRDKFQNIVKTNSPISISIENGYSSSGALPEKSLTLYTDASGSATFDLIGDSKRGDIIVKVNSALASGQTKVWGYLKTISQYVDNLQTVSLFYKHYSATQLPLATDRWAPIARAEALANLDNFYYGLQKESSIPKTIALNLPYYTWQCFFPALDNLVGNFCMQPNGELSTLLVYDANHNISLDVPASNPQPELNPNSTFSSSLQLQSWNYMKPNTDSAPRWVSGNGTDGNLLIDNTVALTAEQIEDGKRKRQAYSVWIDIDWTKKYVLSYTVREQLGFDNRRALEVGIAESELVDPAIINDPDYDLVPLIKKLQEDVYLAAANNAENFRVIYVPTPNTKKVRLYFSTKGRGNNARVLYDNISFKRIDTQNIHDPMVTEGPSVAYLPLFDQAIMFGGSTLEEMPGPYYQAAVSNRNTILTKLLDKSSSVIVENFTPGGAEFDLGDIPLARAHAQLATVGNDKVYLFGGFDSSSKRAFNDVFVYSSSLRKWSEVEIEPDLSVLGAIENPELGKPAPRYQHGFSFVPELNRLYVIGGIRQDAEIESMWYTNDDVWYIDLANLPIKWKRVCNQCGGLASATYINVADALIRLENTVNTTNINNYVMAQRNIRRTNLIWHSASQKFYIHLPEQDFLKAFDPYAGQYLNPETSGIADLKNGFQLAYVPDIGRTFSYQRGNIGQEDSKLKYWDMNPDEKQYLKVRFDLGSDAKSNMQEFAIKVHAYGQSKTIRLEGENTVKGVNTYLYNYITQSWNVLANHSSNTALSVPQLYKKINDGSVRNYVSNEGFVEVLITPKGRPGIDGGEELMGDDLDYVNLGVDFQDNLIEVQQIATSNRSSCALLSNGKIKCWGNNENGVLGHNLQYEGYGTEEGQLGNAAPNTVLFDSNLPQNAGLLVEKIFMGKQHACAIFNNKKAKCWGQNQYGQLGYSDFNDRGRDLPLGESLPFLDVGTLDGTNNTTAAEVVDLALGDSHTCAILKAYSMPSLPAGQREQTLQNRIKCWGRFNFGQVGLINPGSEAGAVAMSGTTEKALQLKGNQTKFLTLPTEYDPVLDVVNRPKKVTKLSTGNNHVCASLSDQTVVCWGDNQYGQLGLNNTTQSAVPTGIQFPNANVNNITINILSLGGDHSCVVFSENSVTSTKCWGRNQYGQLGQGNTLSLGDATGEMQNILPILLPNGLYPIKLDLGQKNTCAVLNNNRLVCWGDNTEGQLGYGISVSKIGATSGSMGNNLNFVNLGSEAGQPIQVKNVVNYGNHNCVLTTNNLLKCFGENGFGQLGYEDQLNRGRGLTAGDGFNDIRLDFIQLESVF